MFTHLLFRFFYRYFAEIWKKSLVMCFAQNNQTRLQKHVVTMIQCVYTTRCDKFHPRWTTLFSFISGKPVATNNLIFCDFKTNQRRPTLLWGNSLHFVCNITQGSSVQKHWNTPTCKRWRSYKMLSGSVGKWNVNPTCINVNTNCNKRVNFIT